MGAQYAVVAFPAFARANSIEVIRRRFDPQARLLAAHVTVVFPLTDERAEPDVTEHVRASVYGMAPFAITLADVSRETDGYLFLNVDVGADRFRKLHETLYAGRWAKHRSPVHEYRPHVTIARVMDDDRLSVAHQEASRTLSLPLLGMVASLAVFRIDKPNHGAVVYEVVLAG